MWIGKEFVILFPPRCSSTTLERILQEASLEGRLLLVKGRDETVAHRHAFPSEAGQEVAGKVVYCAAREPLEWAFSCYENFAVSYNQNFLKTWEGSFDEFVFTHHGQPEPRIFDWFAHWPEKMASDAAPLAAEVVRYRHDDLDFLFNDLNGRFGVPLVQNYPTDNSQKSAAKPLGALATTKFSEQAVLAEIESRPRPARLDN